MLNFLVVPISKFLFIPDLVVAFWCEVRARIDSISKGRFNFWWIVDLRKLAGAESEICCMTSATRSEACLSRERVVRNSVRAVANTSRDCLIRARFSDNSSYSDVKGGATGVSIGRFGLAISHASISPGVAITAPSDLPEGRRTGSAKFLSYRCAVRTPLPK